MSPYVIYVQIKAYISENYKTKLDEIWINFQLKLPNRFTHVLLNILKQFSVIIYVYMMMSLCGTNV